MKNSLLRFKRTLPVILQTVLLICLIGFTQRCQAAGPTGVVIYETTATSSGPTGYTTNGTFTPPAGSYPITVTAACYGGGGGGGGVNGCGSSQHNYGNTFAAGGSGGGFAQGTIVMTSGTGTYTVGTGGGGGNGNGTSGGAGGSSTFTYSGSVLTGGGGSGGLGNNENCGNNTAATTTVGTGSVTGSYTSTAIHNGGIGGGGPVYNGTQSSGGGGGGAGPTGNGGNSGTSPSYFGGAAGTAGTGGHAGAGGTGTSSGDGTPGGTYGGGGGAAGENGHGDQKSGSAGAGGAVYLSYTYDAANSTVYPSQTFCSSGTPSPAIMGVNCTGGLLAAYTYQWYANGVALSGATYSTYTPGALSQTTAYTCIITNGGSGSTTSSPVTITVNPTSVAGTASAGASTICSGGTSTVSVSGYTGSIQWQQSANGTSGWANVSGGSGGTSATYTTPALSSPTYYHAIVTSGICTAATTGAAEVNVVAVPSAGTVTSSPVTGSTVCAGSPVSATFGAGSGGTGTVADVYQSNTDNAGWVTYVPSTNITNATSSVQFRTYRTATGAGCTTSGYSSVAVVNVVTVPSAGTVTSSPVTGSTVCAGSPVSATFGAGSGGTGTVADVYQSNTDNAGWVTYVPSTNITNATSSVQFRTYRTATGAGCTTSGYSSVATVNVVAVPSEGTVTSSPVTGSTVCAGSPVSATFGAGSGGTGTVTDIYESNTDNAGWVTYVPSTNITSATSSVQFRTYRTATGAGCTTSGFSTVAVVNVVAVPSAGTATSSPVTGSTVCAGSPVSATFGAGSGGTGTVTDIYESNTDNAGWVTYVPSTNITSATSSVQFRTYRTATGAGCTTSGYSAVAIVSVVAQPSAGIVTASPALSSLCMGASVTASVSGGNGGTGTVTDVIQYSSNGGAWTTYSVAVPAALTSLQFRTFRTASTIGCSTSGINTAASIPVIPYITPVVTIDPTPNYIICTTDHISFTATPSGTGGVTPTYQWMINSNPVNGATNPAYTDNAPADGAIVTCVMTSNYQCPSPATVTSNPTTMVVGVCNNTWNGSVAGDNTNWDNPGNWSANHVPANCADGANFPPGLAHYPVLTQGEAVGNVIFQQPGGNVNLGNYNLSVCGNITVETATQAPASVIIPSSGGLIVLDGITGSATQTISGTVNAYEVKVNTQATGGAVLASGAGVSVFNALDLQHGNLDVSQGSFTFTSSSVTQAAVLDNFSSGFTGTITGNTVKSQRYYAVSTYFYTHQHMMGSPVSGASTTLAQMGAGSTSGYVIPQADCDEYAMGAGTPYGNVFKLDQSHGTTCGMAQWYVEPGGTAVTNGQGYSVVLPGSGTLTLTGSANTSPDYTLTSLANNNWINATAEHHTLSSGWQLVSNPYQATLALNTANSGMDGQVQVWQANGPFEGTYVAGLVGSVNIAPFQAYMVHVSTPGNMNGSYTINGADRVRTPATFLNQNANELDITAQNMSNNLLDKAVVAFNTSATDSFDTQFDADKFAGSEGRHLVYTALNDGKWMAINTLHDVATTSTVPMGFEPGSSGNYSFTFDKVNTFDPTTYIFLEDKLQQLIYNVRNGNYLFSSDVADNRARFVLHFTPPAIISSTDATCNTLGAINITQPGTASWNYTLTDGSNTVIASGVLNQNNPLRLSAPAGTYTLTLTDNNNYTVTKVVQLNGAQAVTAAFAPSANNVNTQTAVNFANTSQNGNTYSWNFGDGSTSGLVSPVHTYAAPGIYTVELIATNTAGCSATTSQTITVNNMATGINAITENGISLWSNTNRVYVDFTHAGNEVNAVIKIYDVLGQELSEDRYTLNGLYQKEIDNIEAAYIIVAVNNNDKITTKKLFINNIEK